ncbi:Putative dioxygenase [Minicystis rosea]|nr:Putative dioxygenase [Minicystis rosea]
MAIRHLTNMDRRAALEMLSVFGAAIVVGCGGETDGGEGGGTDITECHDIPSETAGPYPDKTGMVDDPTYHRTDITEGKPGVPLTVTFTLVDVNAGCAAIEGATVEIWHCDKDGVYSEYDGQPGASDQTGTTFLRGLQKTDAGGRATFTTIYPGWYQGRVTHIHLDVYVDGQSVKVSQMAFPEDVTRAVYASPLYAEKGQNSLQNDTDMVFSDGDTYQLAEISGDTTSGYTATLTVAISL